MSDRTRIKICGIRDAAMARVAVDAGADAIGVVFVPASPRCVSADDARAVAAAVRPHAALVGVFKGEPLDTIRSLASGVPLDEVQLHGDHTTEAVASFGDTPVVKAISFDPANILDQLSHWTAASANLPNLRGLLIDTPDPTKLGGGTGVTFDWTQLRAVLDASITVPPIILAGGLTPDNIAVAIATVRPWGVDVSSGVESSRGVKDADRIRAFCEAVKNK